MESLSENSANEIARLKKLVESLRNALKKSRDQVGQLRLLKTQSPDVITQCLAEDQDWTSALLANTRHLFKSHKRIELIKFIDAVLDNPSTAQAGRLCSAVRAHYRGDFALMRDTLTGISPLDSLTYIPVEYIWMLFRLDPNQAKRVIRDQLDRASALTPENWLKIAAFALAAKEGSVADEIFRRFDELSWQEKLPPAQVGELDWLRERRANSQIAVKFPSSSKSRPVCFGILDYRSVDASQSSINLGDFIQTAAFLSNLARFQNIRFAEDNDLGKFAKKIQGMVFPDRALAGPRRHVDLVAVNRNASFWSAAPEGTWLLAFGWYMHAPFNYGFDFPFKPSFRPIFISFHINDPAMLTDEALEYLKAKGPIGCRDWNTVDLLLARGVEAFFSGCLSSTIDNILRKPHPGGEEGKGQVAFVDAVPSSLQEKQCLHLRLFVELPEVRERTFTANLEAALTRLQEYCQYDRLVTSKLHCYLPSVAMGAAVDFRPRNQSDIRFEGLTGFQAETISSLREPILFKLRLILEKILAGAEETDVYAFWREICATDVEDAQAHFKTPLPRLVPSDTSSLTSRVLSFAQISEVRHPKENGLIELAFSTDANLKEHLLVLLESCLAHTSRPIRAWIQTREFHQDDFARYEKLFPEIHFCFLPCDSVRFENVLGLDGRITIATMDRLLLPLLLPCPKVLYLDVDLVVLADLGQLYDTPLNDFPLAACNDFTKNPAAYAWVYRASKRLDPATSTEFRRRMHASQDLRPIGFNAGVLLLNLEKMRRDRFCENYLSFGKRYGLNDQEIFNAYANDRRITLDPVWNNPTHAPVTPAKILHWAGSIKPWNSRWSSGRTLWSDYQSRLQQRMAMESK